VLAFACIHTHDINYQTKKISKHVLAKLGFIQKEKKKERHIHGNIFMHISY